MSGGHYNYGFGHVRDLADDILSDVRLHKEPHTDSWGYEREALPEPIIKAMRSVAKKLADLATAAHDIEWLMSGDYGDDTFLECVKEEWPKWIMEDKEGDSDA